MADAIRNPKSGNDWTTADFIGYNITVFTQSGGSFFGVHPESLVPAVDQVLVDFDFNTGDELALPKPTRKLIQFMDLATMPLQESVVADFTRDLLSAMDYDTGDRVVRTRNTIPLVVCGVMKTAQTDVCVMKKNTAILLLGQEDKRFEDYEDAEPQLIAEAIAAFQENNRIRANNGLDKLDRMVMPCIVMLKTLPSFYLVPVTEELSESVRTGQYPDNTTVVLRHVPNMRRRDEGMIPKDNRKIILQCYKAFKRFVDELEELMES